MSAKMLWFMLIVTALVFAALPPPPKANAIPYTPTCYNVDLVVTNDAILQRAWKVQGKICQ